MVCKGLFRSCSAVCSTVFFSFGIAAINNMLVALACYLAGGLLKRK